MRTRFAGNLRDDDKNPAGFSGGGSPAFRTLPPPPQQAAIALPPSPPRDSSGSGAGQRTVGLIAGGVGVVGVGIGIPLWYVGYRAGNSFGPTADQQLLSGQILVIGGGAVVATGSVLFTNGPSGS